MKGEQLIAIFDEALTEFGDCIIVKMETLFPNEVHQLLLVHYYDKRTDGYETIILNSVYTKDDYVKIFRFNRIEGSAYDFINL